MFLIIAALAAFLAMMCLAVLLPLKPNVLRAVKTLVCASDERMEIVTSAASYHRPGERSIEIYCTNYGKKRDVKLKTLLLVFFLLFIVMLPVSFLIVTLVTGFFSRNIG